MREPYRFVKHTVTSHSLGPFSHGRVPFLTRHLDTWAFAMSLSPTKGMERACQLAPKQPPTARGFLQAGGHTRAGFASLRPDIAYDFRKGSYHAPLSVQSLGQRRLLCHAMEE